MGTEFALLGKAVDEGLWAGLVQPLRAVWAAAKMAFQG